MSMALFELLMWMAPSIEKMVDEVMMITKTDTVADCGSAGTRAAQ